MDDARPALPAAGPDPAALAAAARGLPRAPAGAAGLWKAAELASCPLHSLAVLARVSPADVGEASMGLAGLHEGQSPLAVARGVRFEQALLADGAERLRDAVREWPGARSPIGALLDVEAQAPVGPAAGSAAAALAERERITLAALAAAGRPGSPGLVWQPVLTARIAGVAFTVKPDLLVAGAGRYAVAEAKSYPDRGPHTPRADVATALGQAAVGRLAVAQAAARGHGPGPAPDTVLLLARPGSLRPSLRHQTTRREDLVLSRADGAIARAAGAALAALPPGAALADPGAADAVPFRYTGLCRARCALAARCRERARAAGDPAVLGDDAAALLAGTDLHEAAAAAAGRLTPPPGGALERLASAGAAWRAAVGEPAPSSQAAP